MEMATKPAILCKLEFGSKSSFFYPTRGAEQDSNEIKNTVVKRSYSRATLCSFPLTPSHSIAGRKRLTIHAESCETRVSIEVLKSRPNQIPPSTLRALNRVSHLEGSFFYPIGGPNQDSDQNARRQSIYQETLIQLLLPVPLPILVPVQDLTQ